MGFTGGLGSIPSMQRRQKLLVAASVAALACWFIPVLQTLVLPVIYLNTFVHELSHALAALATGGTPSSIVIHADGSGMAWSAGGIRPIVASAGYLGSVAFGGAMIVASRREKGARAMMWALCAAFVLGLIGLVRGDLVGLLACLFWVVATAAMALKLEEDWLVFAAQFLGVQLALTSLNSFLGLIQVNVLTDGANDARTMETLTGVPALAWALLWCVAGVGLVIAGLRSAWRNG